MSDIEAISKKLSQAGVYLLRQAYVAKVAEQRGMSLAFFKKLLPKVTPVLTYGKKQKSTAKRDADITFLTAWLQAIHKEAKNKKWSKDEFKLNINTFFQNKLDDEALEHLMKPRKVNSTVDSEGNNSDGFIQNLQNEFDLSSGRMNSIRKNFNDRLNPSHVQFLEQLFSVEDEIKFWDYATSELEKIMTATVESKSVNVIENKS